MTQQSHRTRSNCHVAATTGAISSSRSVSFASTNPEPVPKQVLKLALEELSDLGGVLPFGFPTAVGESFHVCVPSGSGPSFDTMQALQLGLFGVYLFRMTHVSCAGYSKRTPTDKFLPSLHGVCTWAAEIRSWRYKWNPATFAILGLPKFIASSPSGLRSMW